MGNGGQGKEVKKRKGEGKTVDERGVARRRKIREAKGSQDREGNVKGEDTGSRGWEGGAEEEREGRYGKGTAGSEVREKGRACWGGRKCCGPGQPTKGERVAGRRKSAAVQVLGVKVVQGPHRRGVLDVCDVAGVELRGEAREADVRQLCSQVGVQQHIGWLEIPVKDWLWLGLGRQEKDGRRVGGMMRTGSCVIHAQAISHSLSHRLPLSPVPSADPFLCLHQTYCCPNL